jgi:TPR repeat protein
VTGAETEERRRPATGRAVRQEGAREKKRKRSPKKIMKTTQTSKTNKNTVHMHTPPSPPDTLRRSKRFQVTSDVDTLKRYRKVGSPAETTITEADRERRIASSKLAPYIFTDISDTTKDNSLCNQMDTASDTPDLLSTIRQSYGDRNYVYRSPAFIKHTGTGTSVSTRQEYNNSPQVDFSFTPLLEFSEEEIENDTSWMSEAVSLDMITKVSTPHRTQNEQFSLLDSLFQGVRCGRVDDWRQLNEFATQECIPLAQAMVAVTYATENSIPTDDDSNQEKCGQLAIDWLQAEAAAGCPYAQCFLGIFYHQGITVAVDDFRAFELFTLSAWQAYSVAQCYLGHCYINGQGVSVNAKEGLKWYQLAADKGYAVAQCILGYLFDSGELLAKNEAEAVRLYQLSAEQGYSNAQLLLARCYEAGRGAVKDHTKAAKLYEICAEKGQNEARVRLALFYIHGKGTAKNLKSAKDLLLLAANEGHEVAQDLLGDIFVNPIYDSEDIDQAMKYYGLAAAKGLSRSECKLGVLYLSQSTINNIPGPAEAVKFLKSAAEKGNAEAQYHIGACYQNGIGISQDLVEAASWYRLASGQGHPKAQYCLSRIYCEGLGIEQDPLEGLRCLRCSASQGYEPAVVTCNEVEYLLQNLKWKMS